MSQRPDGDARAMALVEALDAVSDEGCALLICIPGVLALHLPEAPSPSVILALKAQPSTSGRGTS